MRSAFAIFSRDFNSFFMTRRGYVLLGFVLALWGFYFFNVLARYQLLISRAAGMQVSAELNTPTLHDFVITPYFQLVLFTFVLLIPLLAMRSFAEERQQGTFELLCTSAVSLSALVLGKFAALLALVWCFSVIAAFFPLSLAFFGAPNLGLIISGCIAILLCGSAFSSIALACAARTDRQLTAAIIGLFVLSALLLLHIPAPVVGPRLRESLELLSSYLEAAAFIDGYLSAQGVCYFLALTAAGLFATHALLDTERNSHARPLNLRFSVNPLLTIASACALLLVAGLITFATKDGGNALVIAHLGLGFLLLALGIVALVTRRTGADIRSVALLGVRAATLTLLFVLATRSALFIDLSDTRRYTVSPHTRAVLDGVSQPILLRYIAQGDPLADARAERFLESLVSLNPMYLTRETINPVDYPNLKSSFGISSGEVLQIVREAGESKARFGLKQFNEKSISEALTRAQSKSAQRFYLLEAGSAARLSDTGPTGLSKFAIALEEEGLSVAALPATTQEIPNDAAAVALIGPRAALEYAAAAALDRYLDSGGKLLLTLDPLFTNPYEGLLRKLNLTTSGAIVVDYEQVLFSEGRAGLQPLVHNFAEHPITNRLGAATAVIMNVATPLQPLAASSTESPAITPLLWASSGSAAEPEALALLHGKQTYQQALADYGTSEENQLALGAAVESLDSPVAVVFGDSDWFLNAAFEYYANENLALNSAQWLLGNSWALVERARTEISSTVAITPQKFSWFITGTILLAEAIVLFGMLRLWLRGRRNFAR